MLSEAFAEISGDRANAFGKHPRASIMTLARHVRAEPARISRRVRLAICAESA
jgi:hypothetical protein